MEQLTEQELKTLREAEDILFNHIEYGMNNVFDNAFRESRNLNPHWCT